jgi:hypothetical protein
MIYDLRFTIEYGKHEFPGAGPFSIPRSAFRFPYFP